MSTAPQQEQESYGQRYKRSLVNVDREGFLSRVAIMTAGLLPVAYINTVVQGEMGIGEAFLTMLASYLIYAVGYGLLNIYWTYQMAQAEADHERQWAERKREVRQDAGQ